jgi:hypothetical protein
MIANPHATGYDLRPTDATARLIEQVMTRTHARMVELMHEAVAAEREACAKLVEANTDFNMLQDFGMQSTCDQLRTNIAEEIRARSKS